MNWATKKALVIQNSQIAHACTPTHAQHIHSLTYGYVLVCMCITDKQSNCA